MTINPQPERRFVLELKWGADDRKSMAHALRHIAFAIESESSSGRVTSGAPSDGGYYELRENQGVTHDSYFVAVNEWLARKDEATSPCDCGRCPAGPCRDDRPRSDA